MEVDGAKHAFREVAARWDNLVLLPVGLSLVLLAFAVCQDKLGLGHKGGLTALTTSRREVVSRDVARMWAGSLSIAAGEDRIRPCARHAHTHAKLHCV